MSAPAIYHLSIERFRGVKALSWHPVNGVNVILGGGDVGKTTILDAIGLLLSPINPATVSDTDYYARNIEAGFVIEAVLALPPTSGITNQTKTSWPWDWDGSKAVVPSVDADAATESEPVYRVRVCGTPDLELSYQIVQPDDSIENFSADLRRSIGVVRLSGDDRNDRDLRLVQGSALYRLLSDKALRSRLANELAKNDVKGQLTQDAKVGLEALDLAFRARSLPNGLDLEIAAGHGSPIGALIGLTAEREGVQLPLPNWGAGTRRIAALTIAEQNQDESSITIVDEVERGLEPYRQRSLIEKLQVGKSQTFVTTHSPYVIAAASKASLWYVDHTSKIGSLDSTKIARHRKSDPEMFLSRLTVVAEGAAEVGFVTALLEKVLGSPLEQHGVHVSDGGGHEATLGLLEALANGGLRFGAFADDEDGKYPERWEKVRERLGKLLFRWASGCLEKNLIDALPDESLEALLIDPAGDKTGMRLRTLAERLGTPDKDFFTIKTAAGASLRTFMLAAALGKVPDDKSAQRKEYQAHAQDWFKSTQGGHELAEKVFSLGLWPTLQPQLMPFINAVRKAVDLEEILNL